VIPSKATGLASEFAPVAKDQIRGGAALDSRFAHLAILAGSIADDGIVGFLTGIRYWSYLATSPLARSALRIVY